MSADLERSWSRVAQSRGSLKYYPSLIGELVNKGFYYASIPYIKEYLIVSKGNRTRILDDLIDKVVTKVGVKQFEVLPTQIFAIFSFPYVALCFGKETF